jgi:hypothetical protein
MRKTLLLLIPLALVLAGCGGGGSYVARVSAKSPRSCPRGWQAGWQKLATRIRADVYCPGWIPDPLTGQIGGRWNNIDSVSKDRSYLIGFVWQEKNEEIHINLRGYPGVTRIPTCRSVELVGGKKHVTSVACFADPRGEKTVAGFRVTTYTVNQDADQWHLLYAWRSRGSLYTLSEHVAPPFSLGQVHQNLERMLRGLAVVRPAAG